MAIGRLQAALAAATNEVTVAAANLNFDFTLVKYEAPKEYQALGNVLSAKRKDNAELGSIHVLARQLGALFDGICPPTPALLEAYGKRASEIAQASKAMSEPYTGTLFGDYAGIDGTSIWAAATSSKCALHVHLLACLLARVWTAPEAIAIWVEIVAERKRDIARKVDNEEPVAFSLAAAVGQDISRSQLAIWDTSARAWLRTADDVFCRQQKQLELILKNIDLSAPGGPAVFPSVIETWKIAIGTMDKLIAGIPQAVHDGAALLGLSAWHIYPDLSVYNPEMVEVKMEDPLVHEGGVLSLGISKRPGASAKDNGIYWSLSLAQLRYYGHPVKVERGLGADYRLTRAQLDLVVFAAVLEEWGFKHSQSEPIALLVISLVDKSSSFGQGNTGHRRLLKMLKDGASAYVSCPEGFQQTHHRLIQLGRRRAHCFLHNPDRGLKLNEKSPLLWNLLETAIFMSLFKDTESQIKFLRHKASVLSVENTPSDAFMIRYSQPGTTWNHSMADFHFFDKNPSPHLSDTGNAPKTSESASSTIIEQLTIQDGDASSVQEQKVTADELHHQEARSSSVLSKYSSIHSKNAVGDGSDSEGDSDFNHYSDTECEGVDEEEVIYPSEGGFNDSGPAATEIPYPNFFRHIFTTALPPRRDQQKENAPHHRWVPEQLHGVIIPDEEVTTRGTLDKFRCWDDCIQIMTAETSDEYVYHCVLGNPVTAELFARRTPNDDHQALLFNSTPGIEDLQWCLNNDLLSPISLHNRLCVVGFTAIDPISSTLAVLAEAALVYDDMADATIDVNILNSQLIEKQWARHEYHNPMAPEAMLSLISYFESGIHDVDPKQLENVIAVSYANSLFVASAASRLPPPYFHVLIYAVDPRPISDVEEWKSDLPENSWEYRETRTHLPLTSPRANIARAQYRGLEHR